jgi:hypothetical protein
MRHTVLFALLWGLSLAWAAQAKTPSSDIVRETLRASLKEGGTCTSPDKLTHHGAWAFSTEAQASAQNRKDGKQWNAIVEGSRLRLKATLVEQGWDVTDGCQTAPAVPTATAYDLAARREGRALHLCVSFFPGEESAWIAYVQTEKEEEAEPAATANAGSRPSSDDSPASETPSSPGPRG